MLYHFYFAKADFTVACHCGELVEPYDVTEATKQDIFKMGV